MCSGADTGHVKAVISRLHKIGKYGKEIGTIINKIGGKSELSYIVSSDTATASLC